MILLTFYAFASILLGNVPQATFNGKITFSTLEACQNYLNNADGQRAMTEINTIAKRIGERSGQELTTSFECKSGDPDQSPQD